MIYLHRLQHLWSRHSSRSVRDRAENMNHQRKTSRDYRRLHNQCLHKTEHILIFNAIKSMCFMNEYVNQF